jgi:carboxyl-terminal processing protease
MSRLPLSFYSMQTHLKRSRFSVPKKILPFLLASILILGVAAIAVPIIAAASPQAQVFDQVWKTINEQFFDPKFNGVDWNKLKEKYSPQATQAQSSEQFSSVVNQMLGELKTSHTRYYTPNETAYYQLLGVFQPRDRSLKNLPKAIFPNNKLEYSGIGIFTKTIDNKMFINGVLEGLPGAQAGLQIGDEILSANSQPFHPVQSFVKKMGQKVTLQIRRSPNAPIQDIAVTPKLLDPLTMFLDVQRTSTTIIPQGGKKIGYVHIWSYAGDQYQEQLEEDLFSGKLREADGLVLDLRDGWGGAPLNALNIYTARGPSLTSIPRNGQRYLIKAQWKKPVVMIVNEGSRSAKEILAYGFKQYNIGKVVGTKTPGAVVAGRAFLMNDGTMLYVAVSDVFVDGKRLEGEGVAPDIEVPFTVPYAQGKDPQKERAIAVLLQDMTKPQ